MRACAFILLLVAMPWLAQAQTTSLRQPRIYAGDIAELAITSDSELPSMYSVDTTPLLTDFEVLDTDTRVSRVQRDNRSLHRMEWSARLLPRRSGLLVIPPLQYGPNQSDPLVLEVTPVPGALQAAQNVYVELEAIPQNPYPGQPTRIVTRLVHNLPLQGGRLDEPESEHGEVYRSTRDAHYQQRLGGELFNLQERSIFLTPPQSGEWVIHPASFQGSVEADPAGTGEVVAGGVRYLHRASTALQLQVRALPVGQHASTWLPAGQLRMTLRRDDHEVNPAPGTPLDFSLDLEARGLPGAALPADLLLSVSEQYRVYADQPQRSTRIEGSPGKEEIHGRLQQRYVVVFERAGDFTLPALELKWWDTAADRERIARVEATSLTINRPGSGEGHSRSGVDDAREAGLARDSAWQWLLPILLLLFASVWFMRRYAGRWLGFLRRARRLRDSRRSLERACIDNDPRAVHRRLIEWGRLYWQDDKISSLRQLAVRSNQQAFTDELARLDAALYSPARSAWEGKELMRLLPNQRRRAVANKTIEILPGPYPRSAGPIPRAATSPGPV